MTHATLTDEMIPRRSSVPMNLLIVDDEETTRELCATVALQAGLRATAAPSAEQALEALELSAVDILLVDLKLPGMSGLELLKRVSELSADFRHRAHAVRDDRLGHRGHPHRRPRLRHQTVPH